MTQQSNPGLFAWDGLQVHKKHEEKKCEESKHDAESLSTSSGSDVAHYDVFSYVAKINGGGWGLESALLCLSFIAQNPVSLHTYTIQCLIKTNSWYRG